MAGVHAQNGRLLLTFQLAHDGTKLRCREFLGLADTRENRRLAARIAAQVERDLATGSFEYSARFPASRMPKRLGLRPVRGASPVLAEYARQWLQMHRAHLTAGTLYDYGLLIKKQIAGTALGSLALDQISRRDLDRWLVELQEAGTGPRRANMALARLRTIFRLAEEEGLIADNPARLVRSLREPRAAIDPLTSRETEALLRAARPGTERAFVAILLLAGLRPSEALGLQWRDVDLRRKVISVRRGRTRWGDGMTKTQASEREVDVVARLALELDQLSDLRRAGDYVFTGVRGAGLDWNNFRQRNWRRLLRVAGVRMRPPYQCRHTYAASLLADGANPHYVAHQMGHSTLAMVIRHYARWAHKPARDAREAGLASL
ncbi:MAG TPA: tyrosine-type recombinase/integrase [Candidatus Binataceae bacterium]|jgi:integrase|nr:tyrosine-type recombinase/integrase [Candidatus Binataceae bacterium]